MSFIQIDKKAVTEQDAQDMLLQTYALADPLGTPTLFLNPDDFSNHGLQNMPKFVQSIFRSSPPYSGKIMAEVRDRIDDFIDGGAFEHLEGGQRKHVERLLKENAGDFEKIISEAKLNPHIPKMTTLIHFRDVFKAHYFPEEEYESPLRAVIVTPRKNLNAYDIRSYMTGLPVDDAPASLPGTNAHHQFNITWHEIGHGVGAAEPQTELIAASVTKKAFEDCSILSMNADARAVRAIFKHANERVDQTKSGGLIRERDKYGWPMVEANDYIVQVSQDAIDSLSEDNLVRMRFQKFDHLGQSVKSVSDALKWEDRKAFHSRDLQRLGSIAQAFSEKRSTPSDQAQIYDRFALACRRLSIGEDAYDNAGDHPSEQKRITFSPGFYVPD